MMLVISMKNNDFIAIQPYILPTSHKVPSKY